MERTCGCADQETGAAVSLTGPRGAGFLARYLDETAIGARLTVTGLG